MQVFLDDSGTDSTSKCCVLAGYIAADEAWERFSDEWQAVLDASPSIAYLKMSQAESMRREFRGWPREDRTEKLCALAEVILKNVDRAVFSVVKHADYDSIMRGRLPQTVDHPYWLCFQGVVVSVLSRCEQTAEQFDFVFDCQGEGYERRAGYMCTSWRSGLLEPAQEAGLGKISFADDKKALPLQAADMLAWHLRRKADRLVAGLEKEDRPIGALLHQVPMSGRLWNADVMDTFLGLYHDLHPDSPQNSEP